MAEYMKIAISRLSCTRSSYNHGHSVTVVSPAG